VVASAAPVAITDAGAAQTEVSARVIAFFKQYQDGTDFEFLRDACTSPVEQFITLKNADIGKVIENVRKFFREKRALAYEPDLHKLSVSHEGERAVARLPLAMSWGTLPPADWQHPFYEHDDAGWPPLPAGPLYAGLVVHEVTVDVELTFGRDGKLLRYVEAKVEKRMMRVTGEQMCDDVIDDQPPVAVLPKGTVVLDLGDSFQPSTTPRGPQIVRLVRAGGRDTWTYERRSWTGDYNGASFAAGSDCLEPVASAPSVR
jgi:hypothetical protein